jgi:predicted ATPase/class 3 adenylate cyclase/DNA-binding CsgD family transcriptional regulator
MVLPGGTVTLLLADIEGSTRLWENHEAEMPAEIARLDEIVNAAVTAHDGVRPVEQGEGDSFVVAFTSASDAVGCALDLQRAFADGLIRLRMGIHTGEVHRRDEGNYIGPAINRTARIRDAGHGGQVLLSQTAADLVEGNAGLVDLGEHRLRDLGRPERIWQLSHPALRAEFPPLRALESVRNNLPVQLTSFVGRADAIAQVKDALQQQRAVTLTGAGGCGKTRLALHVAADLVDAYPGGVWFVDFAPVNDPAAVGELVVEAMAVSARQGESAVDAIARSVDNAPTLLLFDNCEHVIGECASLEESLLRRCPTLTILATSREPLGIGGELTYRVPSLPNLEALELFNERARRARAQFAMDDTNAAVVAEICERLDGIPLAIELAAARMRVFTPTQVRDGLNDRFRLLTGGARTAVQRQQTLQASVDWSYALLLEPERTLLHRLSVFAGGFTLEAAEAVGVGGILERHHILELLTQLVDKSLVVADDMDGRFGMLETVRQYAAARLVEAGEAESTWRRHFDFFFDATRRRFETVNELRARLDADYDNIRRALQWAEGQAEPDLLVRMAARLYAYWALGRRLVEGHDWLERAVDRADTPAVRGRVLTHFAHVHGMARSWKEAAPLAEEAVDLARTTGISQTVVWSLGVLGNVLANVTRIDEAEAALIEAADLAKEAGDLHGRAFALFQLGRQRLLYDAAGSTQPVEEAITLAQAAGAEYIVDMARPVLGLALWQRGEFERGIELVERGAAGLRKSGETWYLLSILGWLAFVWALAGDDEAAGSTLAEIEDLSADLGRFAAPMLPFFFGLLDVVRGDWDSAAANFEQVESPDVTTWLVGSKIWLDTVRGDVKGARERFNDARALELPAVIGDLVVGAEAWVLAAEGRPGHAERVLREQIDRRHQAFAGALGPTLALGLLGAVVARQGRYEEAARIFGAAQAQADAQHISTDSPYWRSTAPTEVDDARAALGDERFEQLWAEGAALNDEELTAYLQRGRGERKRPTTGWDSLTPTERHVVDLAAEGRSNKEIADKLFMSVATVKSHLTHSYAKLGLSSRAELIAAASSR